jgi:hypothetical protein
VEDHGIGCAIVDFLAPDTIDAILDGTQPPDLTFAKMAQGFH